MDATETATTTTTPAASLVSRMAGAAEGFLATLGPPETEAVAGELGGPEFREWSSLPGSRAGLPLSEMSASQRDAALTRLDTGCSATGAQTARAVIGLDIIRRELGGGDPQPGDDRFWFRVFGTPTTDGPWAWRVNGHHLAVHVTVAGGDLTVTPSFFGSEPGTVRSGPHQGLRVLTAEEELARALLGDPGRGPVSGGHHVRGRAERPPHPQRPRRRPVPHHRRDRARRPRHRSAGWPATTGSPLLRPHPRTRVGRRLGSSPRGRSRRDPVRLGGRQPSR